MNNPEKRNAIHNAVADICKKLGVKRHQIGIFAADRAQMAFNGEIYNVNYENFESLAKLGTDIIFTEKEGLVNTLVPFTTNMGIALVHSGVWSSEYTKFLIEAAQKLGFENIGILTDLPEVVPYPLSSYVINLPGAPLTESLSMAFDVFSLSSFLIMWIATSIFLSQYRYKLGKIKYFSLISIPLIYYIFPFQNYFGDVFCSSLQSYPVFYSIVYILSFRATKQVGALLFSLSFWTAAALVYDDRVRQSLLISSISMAILFGSLELTPLQYRVFPPYGLITEAFIPLGSYLMFVGIFTSAKHISRDAELRKEFHKSAASQLTLLKAIGVSQMEKEFESQIRFVEKRAKLFERTDVPDLKDENIKEILHDVLTELYYSKGKKAI